jgi:flagellar hook-associated protein 3 FlgL
MRVADAFRFEIYKSQLSTLKTKMDRLTSQIASEKKILVPADDPASFAKNIEITAELSQNSQYKKNLNSLKAAGSYYETAVNTMGNVLTQVQQLAVQQASDTVDADSRSTAASQVDDIIQQLVAVGNTKVGNTYLFGGKNASVPAYTLDTTTNTVTFKGTSAVPKVAVDSATTVNGGFSGNTVFAGTIGGQSVDIFQTDTTLATASSSLVAVDAAEAISDYTTLSTAYQAALYTMAKVESLNIMNYLPSA